MNIQTTADGSIATIYFVFNYADGTNSGYTHFINSGGSKTFVSDGAKTLTAISFIYSSETICTMRFILNRGSTVLPYTPYFREALPVPSDALDGWGQGVNAQCYNKLVLDPLEGVKKYRQVCAKRAYKDGDENLANAITDGTKETVYELATPVETNVSAYFTDDNLLRVEAGGTITAVNEFEQAVPFTIEYTVKGA